MTLRNLEQLRLSTCVGATIPRMSTMKRTVVHEDREQMMALMDRNEDSSQNSSVNEYSGIGFGLKPPNSRKKHNESQPDIEPLSVPPIDADNNNSSQNKFKQVG